MTLRERADRAAWALEGAVLRWALSGFVVLLALSWAMR